MNEKIKKQLKEYTAKSQVYITDSGDLAIYGALFIAKKKGYTHLFIPDQGGLLNYKKFGKQLGFEVIVVATNVGIINIEELSNKAKQYPNSVLLCTSLAGYYMEQPLAEINNAVKKNKLFWILDCNNLSESSNKEINPDIIAASFGKWKIVNNYHGGCIASNEIFEKELEEIKEKIQPISLDEDKLLDNLKKAKPRLDFLKKRCKEIITDLNKQSIEVYNKDNKGIVVICRVKE